MVMRELPKTDLSPMTMVVRSGPSCTFWMLAPDRSMRLSSSSFIGVFDSGYRSHVFMRRLFTATWLPSAMMRSGWPL